MNLIIKIDLDNDAFQENPEAELENIFEQIYKRVPGYTPQGFSVRDTNGNTAGTVEVVDLIPIPNPCWDKPEVTE